MSGMKRAVVIGASGAVGGAVASRLEAQGCDVVRLSRSGDGLDLTDEAAVERVLGGIAGPFDLVLHASGALEIDGIEVEIIGDIQKRVTGGPWEPPPDLARLATTVEAEGTQVPVLRL